MAGSDVVKKAVSGNNNYKTGTVVFNTLPLASGTVVDNISVKRQNELDAFENRMTTRFDDPTFYTA